MILRIGGASAGHFIRTLLDIGRPHEVTLFERENRIGGRLLSHDFDGYRQEIGADVCHLGNFFCVEFATKVSFPFAFLESISHSSHCARKLT
jgi:phytoene dehydrogenase-like protein